MTNSSSSPPEDYKSILKMCAAEKTKHDQCFHQWLNEKFLKGLAEKDDCEDVWKEYENCIKVRPYSLVYQEKIIREERM
jgi:hypothetical protein